MTFAFVVFSLVALAVAAYLWGQVVASRRRAYIRGFELPRGLFDKLRQRHPQLDLKQCQLVAQGLRQFFMAHQKSGRRFVAMPSQVVDDLWHEFILYTRHYDAFCRKAFGAFMHHTPAVMLGNVGTDNAGLRRCWWYACKEENIDPRTPARMPLLFALDTKLGIANGFRYVPDCGSVKRDGGGSSGGDVHCCTHFGDGSFAGGSEGFGDGGGGDAGGGGDGGSGCGGGGCGGGD